MGEPTVWDRGPGNHPGRAGVPLLPAPKGPVTSPGTSVPQEAVSPALLSFTSHREHLSNTFSPNSSIGFPRGVLGERRRRRGAEAPAPQGLLLSPWEDAHGGFNARTGRQGTPRATEVMVPWSPPPYAPAPPPSLLRPERTDPSPVSPLSSAHSLASTYRPRHTHGPWCPSLPPPVLLPAPHWPVPVSSVRHTTSSRKSAWTAGDCVSRLCFHHVYIEWGRTERPLQVTSQGSPSLRCWNNPRRRETAGHDSAPPARLCTAARGERKGSAATRPSPPQPRSRL